MTTEVLEQLTTVGCLTPRRNWAQFRVRETTNDAALVFGICQEDEYRFGLLEPLQGWALDIGAHIGIVSVMLALDNPDLRIVAVEAIPANAWMTAENVALNGLNDRVEVVCAAAADDTTATVPIIFDYEWVGVEGAVAPVVDTPYVRDSRYIGNIFEYPEGEQAARVIEQPGVGLAALLDERGISDVTLAKIDCEGCEWAVLRSKAVSRVQLWMGEYHGVPGLGGVKAALGKTHRVTELRDSVPEVHLGLFKAVRKA